MEAPGSNPPETGTASLLSTRQRDAVALLALAGLLAALFFRVLFCGEALFERDIGGAVLGQAETFVRCLAAGALPLWDPYTGFGQPLLGNPGAQVLYPWTWLNLVMQPSTAYAVYTLGHAWLAGVGLYALSRRWGLSRSAALLAGIVWMTSGPFLAFISLWQHFAGAAWIAWVLLAGEMLLHDPSRRHAVLLGFVLGGQVLAGSAELCAATALLLALSLLPRLNWSDPAGRANRTRLAGLLAAFVFAAAFSAAQWLPAAEILRGSPRAGLGESVRAFWSLHPINLVQTLLPVFPRDLPLLSAHRELLFEGREPYLSSVYLGLVPAMLVGVSLTGPRRRLAAALFALMAAGTLLALGRFGVLYGWMVSLVPAFGIFRYPSKAIIVTAFAWALLTGLGWDRCRALLNREGRLPRRLGFLAAILFVPAAACAWLVGSRPGSVAAVLLSPETGGEAASRLLPVAVKLLVAALLSLCVILLVVRTRFRAVRGAAGLLFALAALDLFLAHFDLTPTMPVALLSKPPETLKALAAEGPVRLYNFQYLRRLVGKDYRSRPTPDMLRARPVAGQSRAATEMLAEQAYLGPGVASRWGLQGSFIDDMGLQPVALRNLVLLARSVEDTPALHRLLRVGAVTHVVALHEGGLEDLTPIGVISDIYGAPIRLFRVPDPLPRTLVVGGTRQVTGKSAYDALLDPGFDPAKAAIVADGPALTAPPTFEGASRLLAYSPNHVVIEAWTNHPGVVVLLDGWQVGWRARVDGRETVAIRTNVGFRGAAIEPGVHRVEFFYRPVTLIAGVAASAAAVLLAVAALWRRPSAPPSPPD